MFFGEPSWTLADLLCMTRYAGVVTRRQLAVVQGREVDLDADAGRSCSMDLPEVGDLDKPKLGVLDEADLLFDVRRLPRRDRADRAGDPLQRHGIFVTETPGDAPMGRPRSWATG